MVSWRTYLFLYPLNDVLLILSSQYCGPLSLSSQYFARLSPLGVVLLFLFQPPPGGRTARKARVAAAGRQREAVCDHLGPWRRPFF